MHVGLNISPRQMGIAIGVQQTLFRGQAASETVDVDRTAFQHDAGLETSHPEHISYLPWQIVVAKHFGIFAAPGIETPINQRWWLS